MHVNVKIWNLTSSKYRRPTVNVLWNEICDFYFIFYRAAYKTKEICAYILIPYE